MAVVDRSQTSPDGTLTLEVYEADDLVGFRGEAWHTHGDLLVPEYGRTANEARDAFFDSVVADGVVICVNVEREPPHRITVTDDPDGEILAAGQEAIVLRLWSGKVVGGTPRA
ncbi:hypothetical protein GCM10011521_21290 [Arenimonas soli]|uniref:Uncharacterized protein n=1 Tax=Arenimonas soli TaxID=2269504 RepID=A0ABQ1HNE7_9GAMM|nr:hypothetical protein GCM10011521_21290 [Arenimonas soli]